MENETDMQATTPQDGFTEEEISFEQFGELDNSLTPDRGNNPAEPIAEPVEGQAADQGEPAQAEEGTEPGADATPQAAPERMIPYAYNHKKGLMPESEARARIQKNMLYEQKTAPVVSQLEALAKEAGLDLAGYAEKLKENKRTELDQFFDEEKGVFAEDTRKGLVDAEMQRIFGNKEEDAQGEEDSEAQDLAAEFSELQKVFPDIKTVNDVPQAVFDKAYGENCSLTHAMLLHQHEQLAMAAANRKAEDAAKNASTGAVKPGEVQDDSDVLAFERWMS